MAQHIPIEQFEQKTMRKIAENIRKERYFKGSLKYEQLPEEYNETPEDRVFVTSRAVPKSVCWFKPTLEVHTKPSGSYRHHRIVTNIYLVA